MKRKMRKFLLTLSAVLLLVSMTVGVTVAYLTDEASVINTFTVGKVGISLDEAVTDEMGVDQGTRTVEGNEYKLIPGHTYTKDPTVTVDADSESSFIRMIVTINEIAALKAACGVAENDPFLPQYFVNGWDSSKWVSTGVIGAPAADTCSYEFRYYTTVSTADAAEKKLEPLFESFTLPGNATNAQLLALGEDLEITVVAHAIQADGFASADAAWEKFVPSSN